MHEYLIKWLLSGPGHPLPKGCGSLGGLPADVRAEIGRLAASKVAIAAVWRANEPELRSEAKRLDIRPRWPGRKYFAEAIASEVKL